MSTTTGVAHRLAKLAPWQELSRSMAFVWYLSRLSARGMSRDAARNKAAALAARYDTAQRNKNTIA